MVPQGAAPYSCLLLARQNLNKYITIASSLTHFQGVQILTRAGQRKLGPESLRKASFPDSTDGRVDGL